VKDPTNHEQDGRHAPQGRARVVLEHDFRIECVDSDWMTSGLSLSTVME
jgi:hypothetical protein